MKSNQPTGYMGKILRVDLSKEATTEEFPHASTLRQYLGGTGIGIKYLYDEVSSEIQWNDPRNRLIFASGPLGGTRVGGSGSFSVVTKGPMTPTTSPFIARHTLRYKASPGDKPRAMATRFICTSSTGLRTENLSVEPFPGHARTVRLFAGEPLTFSQTGMRLEIAVPPTAPDPDVSVLIVEIDPSEKGWSEYSAPIPATVEPKKYIKDQAISSFIVNAVLNGAIAFCAYAFIKHFSYYEVAKAS